MDNSMTSDSTGASPNSNSSPIEYGQDAKSVENLREIHDCASSIFSNLDSLNKLLLNNIHSSDEEEKQNSACTESSDCAEARNGHQLTLDTKPSSLHDGDDKCRMNLENIRISASTTEDAGPSLSGKRTSYVSSVRNVVENVRTGSANGDRGAYDDDDSPSKRQRMEDAETFSDAAGIGDSAGCRGESGTDGDATVVSSVFGTFSYRNKAASGSGSGASFGAGSGPGGAGAGGASSSSWTGSGEVQSAAESKSMSPMFGRSSSSSAATPLQYPNCTNHVPNSLSLKSIAVMSFTETWEVLVQEAGWAWKRGKGLISFFFYCPSAPEIEPFESSDAVLEFVVQQLRARELEQLTRALTSRTRAADAVASNSEPSGGGGGSCAAMEEEGGQRGDVSAENGSAADVASMSPSESYANKVKGTLRSWFALQSNRSRKHSFSDLKEAHKSVTSHWMQQFLNQLVQEKAILVHIAGGTGRGVTYSHNPDA